MKKIIPYIKKYLRPALLVFFAAIFLISAGVLADYFTDGKADYRIYGINLVYLALVRFHFR